MQHSEYTSTHQNPKNYQHTKKEELTEPEMFANTRIEIRKVGAESRTQR